MTPYRGMLLVGVSLSFLCASLSNGAEYRSPKGYRLSYPDQWRIASAGDRRALSDAWSTLEGDAKRLLQSIDLDRIDVIIFNPKSDPLQSVNVIVTPGALPVGDAGLAEVRKQLREQFASAGVTLEDMTCTLTTIGGKPAIQTTMTASGAMYGNQAMRQRQVIISGQTRGYIITCSAGVNDALATAPMFDQVVNSFVVESEPSRTAAEWWNGLPGSIRFAIIGALIGGAIGLIRSLFAIFAKPAASPNAGTDAVPRPADTTREQQ